MTWKPPAVDRREDVPLCFRGYIFCGGATPAALGNRSHARTPYRGRDRYHEVLPSLGEFRPWEGDEP